MPNLQDLLDLCRAYDALGKGTPIVSPNVAAVRDAFADAIIAECRKLAGQAAVANAPTAPAAPAETPPWKRPATPAAEDGYFPPETKPAPGAPAAPASDAMPFETYLEKFMAIANSHPHVVKPVLATYGIARGANAKPEDRAAIVEKLQAAANA